MKTNLNYYKSIFREIDEKNTEPVYLFTGMENYIMEELSERIISKIVEDSMRSFNLTLSYGSETDIQQFVNTAKSFPFLSGKRVLVLKEGENLRGNVKELLEYCKSPLDSSVMILIFNTHNEAGRKLRMPKGYRELTGVIKKTGKVIKFEKLGARDLKKWIANKSKQLNIEINTELAETMIRSVGENLYDLKNELDKLSLYFEGSKIEKNDLVKVIGDYKIDALFGFIDSLRPGNELNSLRILLRIIESGAERTSTLVYHMIRHFLSLLKTKAGFKVGGGYLYSKLRSKSKYFQSEDIILWLENLRKTELMIKNTSFPEELLLISLFIHSMKGQMIEREEHYSRIA